MSMDPRVFTTIGATMDEAAESMRRVAAAIADVFDILRTLDWPLYSRDMVLARWWFDVEYVEVFALPDPGTDKAPARVVRCDGMYEDTMVTREQWGFLDPWQRRVPRWWAKAAPREWAVAR